MRATCLALAILFHATAWAAVTPDEILADAVLEARARELGKELRCLVCQNQSIDDSDAPLAHDLRVIVRERLVAGDSDKQIRDFLVARYGDFVLLRPPMKPGTLLLWIGPLLLLAGGGALVWRYLRQRPRQLEEPTLDAGDVGRATAILGEEKSG